MNKIKVSFTKFFVAAVIFVGMSCSSAWMMKPVQQKKASTSDRDVVNSAVRAMKCHMEKTSGKPHLISCRDRFDKNGKRVSREVTVHFSDYRKKPDNLKTTFANGDVARVCEVVYNVYDKEHVSLIYRNPRRESKCLKRRKIKISPATFA